VHRPIGLGDIDLACAADRNLTATDVARAIDEALDLGVTTLEAADDDAARLCGDALRAKRLRDRATLITHVPIFTRPGAPTRHRMLDRLPPPHVQERVESALRACRLDALPLAIIPVRTAWIDSSGWPELAGALSRLVREGKVMQWGARLDLATAERDDRLDDELAEAARLRDPFSALAVRFNACDRSAAPLLATTDRLPVYAREPLAGGLLAGTFGPGVKLSPRDDRHAFDTPLLERAAGFAARLSSLVRDQPPAARSCDSARAIMEQTSTRRPDPPAITLAELALRYVLDRGALPLPRLHRREHLADAITAASAPPLSVDTLAAIERAIG